MTDFVDVNHVAPLEDFVEGAHDYLPGDFLKKKNFLALLDTFIERLKKIDDEMVYMSEQRLITKAEGINLDEIGSQENIERQGLLDGEYRAKILILLSSAAKHGTRGEVISTLSQVFGKGNFTTYKGYNYRFDINISDPCFDVLTILNEILDMLPMPTHLRLTRSIGFGFGFAGDQQAVGFGSVNHPESGTGGLAHLLYVSDDENTNLR